MLQALIENLFFAGLPVFDHPVAVVGGSALLVIVLWVLDESR